MAVGLWPFFWSSFVGTKGVAYHPISDEAVIFHLLLLLGIIDRELILFY
jgi:hypothetical protein